MEIKDNDEICFIKKGLTGKGAIIKLEDFTDEKVLILENSSHTKEIELKSFHMSCKSDKIDTSKNYLGMILYLYKNQTDWYLNEIHCKSGYMYIRIDTSFVDKSKYTMHAQLYKSLFNQWPDKHVIGAGFAIQDGKIKFKSNTFNCNETNKNNWIDKCEWHDEKNTCHEKEEKWIKIALKNWKEGEQNTFIEKPKDICWNCVARINSITDL